MQDENEIIDLDLDMNESEREAAEVLLFKSAQTPEQHHPHPSLEATPKVLPEIEQQGQLPKLEIAPPAWDINHS